MKRVVVVAAKRTPIGSFMGGLSTVPATQLGSTAIAAALEAANIAAAQVEEVFMGMYCRPAPDKHPLGRRQ